MATDLLTPTQLGFSISTSDITKYSGSTLTNITYNPDLGADSVFTGIDNELGSLQTQITAIPAPTTTTAQITTYSGTPTFGCFSFVGTTLDAIINELGLQICINNASISALNTTNIAIGAATPAFNVAPYPAGPAATTADECFIAINSAITTFNTTKVNVTDMTQILESAFTAWCISGATSVSSLPFGVVIASGVFYKTTTTGGTVTIAGATVTLPASRDNYIRANVSTLTYTVNSVTIGAAEPALLTNEIRVAYALTDAVTTTSLIDKRDLAATGSSNIKDDAITSAHIAAGALPSTVLIASGAVAGAYPFADVTVTDRGIVSTITSPVTITAPANQDVLWYDTATTKWVNSAIIGSVLPSGAALNNVLTWNGSAWIAQAPIAFTAIPLSGTTAPITGDLQFATGVKLYTGTSEIILNTASIQINGALLDITSTNLTCSSAATFSGSMFLSDSTAPGAPTASSVTMWADDLNGVAGTDSLHMLTEDGTQYAMGSSMGIGTLTPNSFSILDMQSTSKGILIPRMTTAQVTAIATPTEGLLVYNTTTQKFNHWNAATLAWTPFP